MTYDSFVADEKTVDAVLRNFEVIGEAAKKVPTNVRDEYDEIPWDEMAGMRDKLIHGYATVDLEIVWTTVSEDVPLIVSQLKRIRDHLLHRHNPVFPGDTQTVATPGVQSTTSLSVR